MTALSIARFELVRRARLLSTYVYFVVFLAAAALFTIAAGGGFKGANVAFGSSKVFINAPYALNQTITVLSYLGVLVTAALMGRAVQQDYEHETFHFFFTSPVSPSGYLAGRFLGALVALTGIFSSIALGCFIGVHFPTVEQELVGPGRLAAYLHPYLVSVIPNILSTGAIFFALGALGRRMMPVYVGAVLMLVGYLIAGSLLRDIDDRWIAAMLDPWGNRAMFFTTQYWPIADRNTRLVPLESYFLWNRVLWLGIGAAALALTFARFRFAQPSASGRATRQPEAALEPGPSGPAPRVEPRITRWTHLRMLPRLCWLTFKETVKNVYFLVIALAGMLFLFASATSLGSRFGTSTYPVAYQVLELTAGSFSLFMIIIATFYAGELVWRERDARMDQIHDALPIPTWLPLAMKLGALIGTQVLLTLLILVSSLLIQAFKGYFHFELGLQLHFLFTVFLPDFILACVLAIAVQTLVNQKYVGHFIVVLYWLAVVFASQLGFEDRLYQYGQAPEVKYSDMNGYGHFLPALRWFHLYWALAALALAAACHLFWVRGVESAWRIRLVGARRRFTSPVRLWLGAATAGFIAAGAVIFHNTHRLNESLTQSDFQEAAARYEKRYRARMDDPLPKITGVKMAVDIFPAERRASIRGSYQLKNKTDRAVSAVLLNLHRDMVIRELALDRPHRLERVEEDSVHTAVLEAPLQPGEEATLRFDLEYAAKGFRQRNPINSLAANGTFFDSFLLPRLGYAKTRELVEDKDRRKYGLAPRERMLDRDDPKGLERNCLSGGEADFVTFEATVSTSKDQIALAPGYLQREWEEGGRRYFEYKMDAPILNFFSFLSARYTVQRDSWNGVAIEVYYHPGHDYNVARMIASVKASLEYFTKAFGPYQHRQLRILEFPRYAEFAQSFPNTVPYSEAIGFIAKVDESDPEDVDYPYFVTAHEVAHQWWAHQVIGGDVQGCSMLAETLSEYSALMVMKAKYGPERMRKFLRYEQDRYLMGRAFEQKKEVPLARVENQTYIHYAKGGMVMYALADLIGEDAVNRALAAFLERTKLKGPPYPNTTQLIADLRKEVPPELQYVIDDWFERIVLYENRAIEASYRARPDGKFEVTMKVIVRKVQSDELGAEQEAPLQDIIEIGALDDENKPIALERRRFDKSGEVELTLVVDRAPTRAGIDPLNKLVDRSEKDNTVKVEAL